MTEAAAIAFPDTYAITDPDRIAYRLEPSGVAVDYRTLVDVSRRTARLLRERGVRRGDCVALLMDNTVGFLETAWACQRSGLRYAAISTRLTASEVAYILADSGAVALVTNDRLSPLAAAAAAELDRRVRLLCVDAAPDGFEHLAALLAPLSGEPLPDEAEGVDLLYSSGTTGRPKGVQAPLLLAPLGTPPGVSWLLQDRWGFGGDTVYLSPAPLYHSAPLRFSMGVHRFGGTVVVMEQFDAADALRLVERHRVTHTQMVPTMLIRLLRLPEEERRARDTSSLRVVLHAAAPCPPEVKRQMIEWLGPIVEEYYSSTENSLFTTITSEEALDRPGSVGRALVGTPHICDDEGNELPPGEPGVVWSEGGQEFAYLGDPEKTAASRNDRGWTTVGDIGHLDEAGYLYLSDRRADLVISGGVNVYPLEAENVLLVHPLVADAAVFGIPHEELGEELKGVVQLVDTAQPSAAVEQQLLDFCAARLARYKCPRSIDFRAELPRTPTGKLVKRLLRDEYRAAARSPA